MKKTTLGLGALCIGISALTMLSSCGNRKAHNKSEKTGWAYNDKNLGGFEVRNYNGQVQGPGLVLVEGGRFTMGQTDDEIVQYRNNQPKTVSVSSFYMDETEVANVHYREYTYWLERAYGSDYPELVAMAYPDSTAWRSGLTYSEPMVKYYFRHAAYNFYPVVGVSWHQANKYCEWRSSRVNEQILIDRGILKKNPNQVNEDVFETEAYVYDQYVGLPGKRKQRDLNPTGSDKRNTTYSDGTLLPDYRLPTEAEWEFAARAEGSENPEASNKRRRGEEALVNRKNYPWGNPRSTRYSGKGDENGQYYENYMRGKGDGAGIPGGLNDGAVRTAPIDAYWPNALGLYNMAGNVSEWTLDVYRDDYTDYAGLNPYRGNVYLKDSLEEGSIAEKDSVGSLFKIQMDKKDLTENWDRDYDHADVRDMGDGDANSGYSYNFGYTSLINNETMVIKGASWADRAYYLSPSTRRGMQANHSSATVGFRCVMDRLGSMSGNQFPGGNEFKKRKSRR